jgi:hypothetical protein
MATNNMTRIFYFITNLKQSLVDVLYTRKGGHRVGLVANTISLQGFSFRISNES